MPDSARLRFGVIGVDHTTFWSRWVVCSNSGASVLGGTRMGSRARWRRSGNSFRNSVVSMTGDGSSRILRLR